jgi:hypothetical protein
MSTTFKDSERYAKAVAMIDAANLEDPRRVSDGEAQHPYELLYARRVLDWIQRLAADASEALLLSGRGQHICRWMIPRERYAMDLKGYLEWRETLKQFHAEKMEAILNEAGYPRSFTARVRGLITKELYPDDSEARTLEDALCLVFLEMQLTDMVKSKPGDRVVEIVRKLWTKMTPVAQRCALALELDEAARATLLRATGNSESP